MSIILKMRWRMMDYKSFKNLNDLEVELDVIKKSKNITQKPNYVTIERLIILNH